jgi:hypothetical protein
VRSACALALHAFEVATALEEGRFYQWQAERFAPALLIPGKEFLALVDGSDAAPAEWFGVPVEQVPLRRAELHLPRAWLGPALMDSFAAAWLPPCDQASASTRARARATTQTSNQPPTAIRG